MGSQCPALPDEIWAAIFTLIPTHHHNHQQLEPLTLVCKNFLTLTNFLHHTLRILTPQTTLSIPIPILLRRFPNLRNINASTFTGDVDQLIFHIAQSRLPIEEINLSNQRILPTKSLSRFGREFTRLKVFKCAKLRILRNRDLKVAADSLPWIEDLDISYAENDCDRYAMDEVGIMRIGKADLSDAGIEEVAIKLPGLRKINVSGNAFISDRSVVTLARSCVELQEVVAVDCCFVTQIGIAEAIRESCSLKSVAVSGMDFAYSEIGPVVDSIGRGRALSGLHFAYSSVSDEFLSLLAREGLPLKQLSLSNCFGFSLSGILVMILAYRCLTCLSLERVECLTDEAMAGLAEYLTGLTSVNLNWCSKVGGLTFFELVKSCGSLESLEMERTSLGKGEVPDYTEMIMVNRNMKRLKVARNSLLTDEWVTGIALSCPNLELVDLSQCKEITANGVSTVLSVCKKIRHLCLNQLVMDGLMKWEKYKVEVLEMKGVMGIDDDDLETLGEGCPDLLSIDLSNCLNVRTAGVKRLVRKCTKLREVKMDWCHDMSFGNLVSMVFSRQSLRKVVLCSKSNGDELLGENQKNVLLRHGCRVVQD